MALTRRQQTILEQAIESVTSRDPDDVLREHLEEIAAGRFVTPLTSADEARDLLKQFPKTTDH